MKRIFVASLMPKQGDPSTRSVTYTGRGSFQVRFVTGLPLVYYQRQRAGLKKMLLDTHSGKIVEPDRQSQSVTIVEAGIIPQGLGVFFCRALKPGGELAGDEWAEASTAAGAPSLLTGWIWLRLPAATGSSPGYAAIKENTMTSLIAVGSDVNDILLCTAADNKDSRYRLSKFVRWLDERHLSWYQPSLAAYRDDLLARGLAPATVSAHLSTIRARYKTLLRERDLFFNLAPRTYPDGTPLGPADRKAMVDEIITRLAHAVAPESAPVQTVVRQDRPDSDHLRLTRPQANTLLAAPGVDTLAGLRDTVVMALMLSTGIREAELSALEVVDLRQRLGGELALHVRRGKGCKERLIPYGALQWVLAVVDRWLERAGIDEGPVVRSFYKGNQRLRPGRLSVRAIQYILADYPVMIDGTLKAVKPHDLRRTYARRLYQAGVRVEAIRQNLGHADLKTTLGYIGALDVDARRPPQIYDFDLSRLARPAGKSGG